MWNGEGWLTYYPPSAYANALTRYNTNLANNVSGLVAPNPNHFKYPSQMLFNSGMIDFAGSGVWMLVHGSS